MKMKISNEQRPHIIELLSMLSGMTEYEQKDDRPFQDINFKNLETDKVEHKIKEWDRYRSKLSDVFNEFRFNREITPTNISTLEKVINEINGLKIRHKEKGEFYIYDEGVILEFNYNLDGGELSLSAKRV